MVPDRGALIMGLRGPVSETRRRVGTPRPGVAVLAGLVALGSIGASAALALARVSGTGERRTIELTALVPAGLPLALLALLALVPYLRRRPVLVGAPLAMAVGLAVLHAGWLAPRFLGGAPVVLEGSPRLVVLAQNFEEGDAAALRTLVEQHEVDVLVLTDAGPDQVAAVVAAGVGEVLTHDTTQRAGGSVVWSRYPITSDDLVSDGGDSRVVTVDVPRMGEVGVVAVHPTPPYQEDGRRWRADWDRVITRVREVVGEEANGRVVVAGDFNATLDHIPVRTLRSMGFRDAGEQVDAGLSSTWPANGSWSRFGVSVPPFVALDHVMTAPGLVAVEQVVDGATGSDHLGLVATLAIAGHVNGVQ